MRLDDCNRSCFVTFVAQLIQCINDAGIVATLRACLHNDHALNADGFVHGEHVVHACNARGESAVVGKRVAFLRAKDMHVAVASLGGHFE
jgi:hypothetical protein